MHNNFKSVEAVPTVKEQPPFLLQGLWFQNTDSQRTDFHPFGVFPHSK
jgi:hypothetical protein